MTRKPKIHPLAKREKPGGEDLLRQLAGSKDRIFNNELGNAVARTVWLPKNLSPEDTADRRYAAYVAMFAFKPQDEIEGMLAAQAVAMHMASMECLRRAMIPDQPFEAASRLRKDSANMARGMVEMLDALDRKRGKPVRQVVRVEKVMVAPGAQAVVGNVALGVGGESNGKRGEEPHAPPAGLAHDATSGAILPPLRSDDAERVLMPSAGDGERAVPDARRGQHGAAHG